MTNEDPFSHSNSRYERPLQPYRCGRARRWQQPCWQGPDTNAKCGGQNECVPTRQGDGYICKRPAHAGGPCLQGPLPDGSCCNQRPACVPQPSLRKRRRRYTLLALLVPLIALISLANISSSPLTAPHLSVNPGPLSRVHQEFIGEKGCQSCHTDQQNSAQGIVKAILTHTTINQGCENCHDFAGRSELPHNSIFPSRNDLQPTQCLDCHSEHHGDEGLVPKLSNAQCGLACHQQPFTDFATAHPEFPANFPSESPGSIQFDHQRHFKRHFVQYFRGADPAVVDQAKQCVSCHSVEQATREVTPRAYQDICANCHDKDITGTILVIARQDEPTPISALLLGIEVDDSDSFDQLREEFLQGMADDGVDYFTELFDQQGLASPQAKAIIEQLEEIPLDEISSAWIEQESIEIAATNGLSADDDALYYRLTGHGDLFAKRWLELAGKKLLLSGDEVSRDHSQVLLSTLGSDDDGTSCGKCHALGQVAETGQLPWHYQGSTNRPMSRYVHGPHINLLGINRSCNNCHLINQEANYGDYFELVANGETPDSTRYESNFHPINVGKCSSCHNQQGVKNNCTTCHTYHQNLTLSGNALQRESASTQPVLAPDSQTPIEDQL